VKEGLALLRKMGVTDDIAGVYIRLVPLRLVGIDDETAKKLACHLSRGKNGATN